MNKELEEAKEWLKKNIAYYGEQLKIISALDDSDYYDEETELYKNRTRIFETVLNYIENSMPKQKIEEKIRERQFELQQEYKDFKDDIKLNTLQDLLEGENK